MGSLSIINTTEITEIEKVATETGMTGLSKSRQRKLRDKNRVVKVRVCKYFKKGKCTQGDGCSFSHEDRHTQRKKSDQNRKSIAEDDIAEEEEEEEAVEAQAPPKAVSAKTSQAPATAAEVPANAPPADFSEVPAKAAPAGVPPAPAKAVPAKASLGSAKIAAPPAEITKVPSKAPPASVPPAPAKAVPAKANQGSAKTNEVLAKAPPAEFAEAPAKAPPAKLAEIPAKAAPADQGAVPSKAPPKIAKAVVDTEVECRNSDFDQHLIDTHSATNFSKWIKVEVETWRPMGKKSWAEMSDSEDEGVVCAIQSPSKAAVKVPTGRISDIESRSPIDSQMCLS